MTKLEKRANKYALEVWGPRDCLSSDRRKASLAYTRGVREDRQRIWKQLTGVDGPFALFECPDPVNEVRLKLYAIIFEEAEK